VLNYELCKEGFYVERQKPLPVIWDDIKLNLGFRIDLMIERQLIIELKSVQDICAVHKKQVLTYLRLTGLKLGLLINFNEALIKHGIQRIVNGL